jgi:hypothetical protein
MITKITMDTPIKNILHQIGDIKFHPNNVPHITHGITRTGLHAANDKCAA